MADTTPILNLVIPPSGTLEVKSGATQTIDSGATLTINGTLNGSFFGSGVPAALTQALTGTGSLVAATSPTINQPYFSPAPTVAGAGTVSQSGTTVTGVGTNFTTCGLVVGSNFLPATATPYFLRIVAINSDTSLTVNQSQSYSGLTWYFENPVFSTISNTGSISGIDSRRGYYFNLANPSSSTGEMALWGGKTGQNWLWVVDPSSGYLELQDITGGASPFIIQTSCPANSLVITSTGVTSVGNMTAVEFFGSGAGLTNLPAASITGTLGVAHGGTGATSLTSGNILVGNGTSAVGYIVPGTGVAAALAAGINQASGLVALDSSGQVPTLLAASPLSYTTQPTAPFGYVLSSFLNNASSPNLAANQSELRIAVSQTGETWGGISTSALFNSSTGELRDPSIIYYNGQWWVAYTSHAFTGTGDATHFGLTNSLDLANWTTNTLISTAGAGTVTASWAPEWYVDPGTTSYTGLHILISLTIGGTATIYEMHPTNAALTSWSTPVSLGVGGIDPYCVLVGSTYHLFVTNSGTNVSRYTASSLTGTYTLAASNIFSGAGGQFEGTTIVQTGSTSWRAWCDTSVGGVPGLSYCDSTNNFSTWSTMTQCASLGNDGYYYSHGTVLPIYDAQKWAQVCASPDKVNKNVFDSIDCNVINTPPGQITTINGATANSNCLLAMHNYNGGGNLNTWAFSTGYNGTGNLFFVQFSDNFSNQAAWLEVQSSTFGSFSYITFPTTAPVNFGGNINLTGVGYTMSLKGGTNAASGTVTLSSGTATITSTAITNSSVIVFSRSLSSGTPGPYQPVATCSSGSATVTGLSTDNSVYTWVALLGNQ